MKKVLIIDDDADFTEAIETVLSYEGYDVYHARDGTEGVDIAVRERPDVILCDVMMRERTEGFFTIQRIRHTPGLEQTPILVMSSVYQAIPAFDVPPESGWLGHNGFLRKPVDPGMLLELIEESA